MFETWPDEITAESAEQTSGVVSLTSETEGAIAYADASQVGDLGTVAVQVGEEYVPYSAEAAAAAVENSEPNEEAEGAVNLERDTTEASSYPIVLVSYHIFCHSYQDQETADQVPGIRRVRALRGWPAGCCQVRRKCPDLRGHPQIGDGAAQRRRRSGVILPPCLRSPMQPQVSHTSAEACGSSCCGG